MDELISTLEYLISGDCTEPAIDYADEISQAIEIIKEHKEAKPLTTYGTRPGDIGFRCGNCKIAFVQKYHKYCWHCGTKIIWDDVDFGNF